MLRFHEKPPDILKETVRLSEKTVLVFPNFQMHFKECPEFLLRLREANHETPTLRFPDGPVSGIVHGTPKGFRLRPQIQTMPLGLLDERESLIGKRQVIVQAEHGNLPLADERFSRSEEHTSELQSLRHLVCR